MVMSGGAVLAKKNEPTPIEVKADELPANDEKREESKKVLSVNSDAKRKAIRGWNEIAEKSVGSDGFLLSFLKLAKAYIDESNRVSIHFANDFAKEMIEKAQIKSALSAALTSELQQAINENSIVFELTAVGDEADIEDDLSEFEV